MKHGKLKVTTDLGDGYTSEATYHVYSFEDGGVDASALVNVDSVDHVAKVYYGVDACSNPQGIFGTASTVTLTWIEEPAVTGLYIEHGDNLNSYTEPGVYCRALAASDANSVANTPPAMHDSTFVLEVFRAGSGTQIVQRATRCHKASKAVAERTYYGGAWGDWETTYVNGKRVLWSGAKYMTASQTVQLGENVSDMPHGIVLVFSGYSDGAAQNCDFVEFYVPKHTVETHVGCGHSFVMANSNATRVGHKYLYINDDQITGHANNTATGEASGITWNSNYFVLRYVLGA